MTHLPGVSDADFDALCDLDHASMIALPLRAVPVTASVGAFTFRDQKTRLLRDRNTILQDAVLIPPRRRRGHAVEVFHLPTPPAKLRLVASR